ncbi:cytochrome b5-related protein-like [Belonocnema kinseyi]|uniref:cytochrome b5-related protein-like n=1 Tax=Belonocnema kinseyi TaxID=2817044 RepID=UPI00143D3493|nr:cytochrome b5-related protein-like [Belonocnema kinseyi]
MKVERIECEIRQLELFINVLIFRKDLDWGLLALDAVRGRKVVDDSLFLSLTSFGSHTLHHLLPTIDNAYLPLCKDAYRETCEEFGLNLDDSMTQWEHVKGQFHQLVRLESKYNSR